MSDPLNFMRAALLLAEFGQRVSGALSGVRLIHESNDETLKRVIAQAVKTICPYCRGTGQAVVVDGPCRTCHGTGERAYDPHEGGVREVMDS